MPKPTMFANLDDQEDGYEIEMIEGTITKVYPIKEKGKKPGKGNYFFQNFMVKDDEGDEYKCCMTHWDLKMNEKEVLKKRIRVTGDMAIKISGDSDQYHTINIGKDAEVEFIGSGGEPKPGKSEKGSGGGKSSSGTPITIRQRVFAYFKALGLVVKGYNAMKESEELPELDGGQLKEIATHVCMNDGYNNGLPYFGQSTDKAVESFEDAAEETEKEKSEENEDEDKPKKESVPSWEEAEHPKTGVKLEDTPEKKLKEYALWALTADMSEQPKEVKKWQATLLTMAASKKWSIQYFLAQELGKRGYGKEDGFTDAALDLACNEKYEVKFNDLDEDQKKEILDEADEFADLCKEKEKEGAEETPKKKKKGAVPE